MEDELMRLFGGQQADSIMQRMKIDDDFPIELGLVSRLVEGSQTRVEGANFDVRKHLLEYDDVLNSQRAAIYSQRDLIFVKEDLTEDVTEMLRTEVNRRVPEALEDEGGPWKLLAWLEQIQPTLSMSGLYFPSYTLQLLLDHLKLSLPDNPSPGEVKQALLEIAQGSLETEKQHLLQSVQHILEQSENRLDIQIADRMETVETFFEGLGLEDEEESRRPAQLMNELAGAARLPVRLTQEQQRELVDNPRSLLNVVQEQVRAEIQPPGGPHPFRCVSGA
jgi:preprotein translocase subunit SecA